MEKQQKILEMAKDICRVKLNCNDVCNPVSACDALKYAERAYEAGYVKVVRCKECVHWETIKTLYGEDNVCKRQGCMTVAKLPDDYCSLGEMKGGK